MLGRIHSFESFGTVDGPGIRFVVFMQGCPLRCKYCHNPDTWNFSGGREISAEEVVKNALKYKNYIKNGGVTLTGGEPLMQPEFAAEIFRLLKAEGIHTALDTSGATFVKNDPVNVARHDGVLRYTDLVLLDIKHIDGGEHAKLTGVPNANTLDFARHLSDAGKQIWIRHVLVTGVTDRDEYLYALKDFIGGLKTVTKVEVLPYHAMGESKYARLGIAYPFQGMRPPDRERVENAKRILKL